MTEHDEQCAVMQWAALRAGKWPELALLHHIPNGGSRNRTEAARLQAAGVKPGVPDLCLPVPRGQYHGLYIEMKRPEKSRTSPDQIKWLTGLSAQGYRAVVCHGWQDAVSEIENYMEAEK